MSLVIARRPGERFFIGSDVEVRVIETRNGKMRIRITAPDSVSISWPDKETDAADREAHREIRTGRDVVQ